MESPLNRNMRAIIPESQENTWPLRATRMDRRELLRKFESRFEPDKLDTRNVAAIDFGTTFLSLAYIVAGENEPKALKLDNVYFRVPNSILLQTEDSSGKDAALLDCKAIDIGETAKQRYLKKIGRRDSKNYLLFERTKLALQDEEEVHRNLEIHSINGFKCYVVEVIAFTLQYLKQEFQRALTQRDDEWKKLKASDFKWVITVPAIWKARGRQMMREAAYMAGLCSEQGGINALHKTGRGIPRPTEVNPDHIMIVVEPEAAAIYCQRLNPSGGIASFCSTPASLRLAEKFLVVDIGGGTVDVTVHSAVAGNKLETVGAPIGNGWGGTAVNREFASFLSEIVKDEADNRKGIKAFDRYLSEPDGRNVADLSEIVYGQFSKEKEAFGMGFDKLVEDDEIGIQLSPTLCDFYTDGKIKQGVQEYLRKHQIPSSQSQQDSLTYINRTLYFYPSIFEKFFIPAIDRILDCIKAAIARTKGIKFICMVGGFGGCKYVHDKVSVGMDKEYGKGAIKLIVPDDHKLAVVYGAALYGRHPELIQTRMVDATYGIAVNVPYHPQVHPLHYRYFDEEGDEVCCDAFLAFVTNGQSIHHSDIYVATLHPEQQSKHRIDIPIYGTPKPKLEYFLDKDDRQQARELARCSIDIPNDDFLDRSQRELKLLLDFSSTEVQAQIIYMDTKKVQKVVVDFLSVQPK